jgi:hypothetical protein
VSGDEQPDGYVRQVTEAEAQAVNFDLPLTRAEFMRGILAIHEALLEQAVLLRMAATLQPTIPPDMIESTFKLSAKLIDLPLEFLKEWSTADGE